MELFKKWDFIPERTFITKYAVSLNLIDKHPRITSLELGATIGLMEMVVRKVIADLYSAGCIDKKKEGRGIKYRISPDLPLRHDKHREVAIGDFLESLG